jgi:hypothetical protein
MFERGVRDGGPLALTYQDAVTTSCWLFRLISDNMGDIGGGEKEGTDNPREEERDEWQSNMSST